MGIRYFTIVKCRCRFICRYSGFWRAYLCDAKKMMKMEKRKKLVLIDNGHGVETPGKRSPDGCHREYLWCREIAVRLGRALGEAGIEAALLVPELADVPLAVRCARAASLARGRDAVLVSLHNNASGSGAEWGRACGWSVFVGPNASAASKRLAALLYAHARSENILGNRCTPPSGYWTANLAICRDTPCPAVLTENMFQDHRADVAFLSGEHGKDVITRLHCRAVSEYFGIA